MRQVSEGNCSPGVESDSPLLVGRTGCTGCNYPDMDLHDNRDLQVDVTSC